MWSKSVPSPSGVARSFSRYCAKQLDVIAIDLGHLRDQLRNVIVVRQRVVSLGNVDLRVWTSAIKIEALSLDSTIVKVHPDGTGR